jgi:hypothetical protein
MKKRFVAVFHIQTPSGFPGEVWMCHNPHPFRMGVLLHTTT